jgi:hypothetical protein
MYFNRRTLLGSGLGAVAWSLGGSPALAAPTSRVENWLLRRSEDRGQHVNSWLNTRYTFSFSRFRDPMWNRFRALRVMNEDFIRAGGGFPTHPHRDQEIITYVLSGALEHEDTLGNSGRVKPGLVQHMSAGTGIQHSEFNKAKVDCHLLQVWLTPDRTGHPPGYTQALFSEGERREDWRLLASPGGGDGSIKIHQNCQLYAAILSKGQHLEFDNFAGRASWIQVARGSVVVNGQRLIAGDGAATEQAGHVMVAADADCELIRFDLA